MYFPASELRDIAEARRAAGMKPRKTTNRECLSCAKLFVSKGPQNRLCAKCSPREEVLRTQEPPYGGTHGLY